ncbi:hypothetical protein EYS14_19700 [Alteromonadaceae bacterium M269]|nr:hypothetical protein EYS14_19700 [Alteromonadaceae bacterium M269]
MDEFDFYESVSNLSPNNLQDIIDQDINKAFNRSPSFSVRELLSELDARNIKSYIVGGAVRDWLSGQSSRDIDISVDCRTEGALDFLRETIGDNIPMDIHAHFGHICIEGDISPIDINVLRNSADITRGFYTSNFKGGASLKEDADTRDFSINSFYYDDKTRSIFSPFGSAYDDLKNNRITVVSDKKTLNANFGLCIRIILFMSRGYTASPNVLALLKQRLEKDILGYEEFGMWLNHFYPEDEEQAETFKRLIFQNIQAHEAIDKVNNWLAS